MDAFMSEFQIVFHWHLLDLQHPPFSAYKVAISRPNGKLGRRNGSTPNSSAGRSADVVIDCLNRFLSARIWKWLILTRRVSGAGPARWYFSPTAARTELSRAG